MSGRGSDPPASVAQTSGRIQTKKLVHSCLLNARSVRNKCCELRDFIIENAVDLFFITETWLNEHDTSVIASFVPDTHVFHHFPRLSSQGGGVGVVISKSFHGVKSFNRVQNSFECMELHITHCSRKLIAYIIYRSPSRYEGNFLAEYEQFLLESETNDCDILYVGDFNIWMDVQENDFSSYLSSVLESFNLENIVNVPTHEAGHTLDLVILRKHSALVHDMKVGNDGIFSDHKMISFRMNLEVLSHQIKEIKFRLHNDRL